VIPDRAGTLAQTATVLTRGASILVIVLAAVLLSAQTAFAASETWQGSENDLSLTVDANWPGCRTGGYFPFRIRLQNRAADRTVTVRFVPEQSGLPTVSRTLQLAQNAVVSTSLLIPMVGPENTGELQVSDQTGVLKTLTRYVSLAAVDLTESSLSLLVISEKTPDFTDFEGAVVDLLHSSAASSYGGALTADDHAVVRPDWLPDTWVAYSGLDLVAVSRATLAGLAHQSRSALLDWVKARGMLLVYDVGENPAEDSRLNALLGLDQSSQDDQWMPVINSSFEIRSLGLGSVLTVQNQIFADDGDDRLNDWIQLFSSLGSNRLLSTNRTGVAGRANNGDFMMFLIPGVQSLPVFAFLIFITVFTVAIGPFNYYMLSRRKRLNLLLISIPAIALVTSLLLFMYSIFAHGFSVKSRVRSVTLLDQGSQTAVTTARLALYAGFTPSDGLEFSQRTAVTPIWPSGQTFESGRVDWSQTQALRSGFLRSRTRTQFLTTQVRDERGRLTIQSSDAEMNVSNGLEWNLAALIVTDGEGRVFAGQALSAGESTKLSPISEQDRKLALGLLGRSTPAAPAGLRADNSWALRTRSYYRDMRAQRTYDISVGEMERQISGMSSAVNGDQQFRKRSYLAFVAEDSEQFPVELGTDATVVDGWHIVIGYY